MKKRRAILTLLALLCAAPTSAQEPVPTLVRVDLLLFRHISASPEQVSNILSVPLRPNDNIQASVEPVSFSTATSTANGANAIQLLADESTLDGFVEKLDQSEHFELLHQISWQQPAYDPQNALRVSLVPDRRGGLLKGSAKLSFERYFQLVMTLLYEPGFAMTEPSEQNSPESNTAFIHLKEVMTDNKLYYLDHPLLGALAQVTVLETAAPQ